MPWLSGPGRCKVNIRPGTQVLLSANGSLESLDRKTVSWMPRSCLKRERREEWWRERKNERIVKQALFYLAAVSGHLFKY